MNLILSYTIAGISVMGVLGILAFATSLVVDVLEAVIPKLKETPSKLTVIIVALIITIMAAVIYCQIMSLAIYWYYYILAIFAGFVVAYISMYGWDTFTELKDRFIKE